MKKTVSTSGASLRLMCAIWSSDSKSLTARRPRTMKRGADRAREVDGQAVEAGHLDPRRRRRRASSSSASRDDRDALVAGRAAGDFAG